MGLYVSSIAVYPVKSFSATYPREVTLSDTGFLHDRAWMVVNESGMFLTQRAHPKMALIRATVVDAHGADGAAVVDTQGADAVGSSTAAVAGAAASSAAVGASSLRLAVPGEDAVNVPIVDDRGPQNPALTVRVWKDRCEAVDQGDVAAEMLSRYLKSECRLVRMSGGFRRELGSSYPAVPGIAVGFADSAPLMLISEPSLNDLNTRLERPAPMDRFRPNIVVAGGTPYQEDRWQRIRIGGVTMRVVKDCIRCAVVNVDQRTGETGTEPLKTLVEYRSGPHGPRFGRKVVHEGTGVIRPGDLVEVLES